ncbi:MAG TPA: SpoIIE family protein phosphatase [Spirochaetota bacterium]|nr:SpoIIE family protein phosphatase [Spirochaetota bacterium]HPJ35620.1 SpoIIE family protein phosphatase [Spirochaetota bacterium]
MKSRNSISDAIWSFIGVTEELLALNYKPGYRPWHVMEIRGSFIYFISIAGITFVAAIFQLFAGIHITTVIIPFAINFTVSVMAWLIYTRKKQLREATRLSFITSILFAVSIISSRYIYAIQLGWDIALMSYNIAVLYITLVITNLFLYNKKIYRTVFFLILANWIIFLAVAYYSGAEIYIRVVEGVTVNTGFNLLREIFIMIIMFFITIAVYMNIPIIEAYEEKTAAQQKIIEEYNNFLAKKIEEKTRELHSELRERKNAENILRKFSAAVQHSPASICITDRTGRIEYINPRFEEMTGYTLEEVTGKRPEDFLNRSLLQNEVNMIIDVIKSGGKWTGELKNIRKNGTEYWELASISSIKDENNKITNYVAVEEDITLRKTIENELKENQLKLMERNQIIEKEISIAEIVQRTLLRADSGNWERFKMDFRQRCVEKIGGDFFTVKSTGSDDMSVFIGDISGHGVASSLFISLLKFITDDLYSRYREDPVEYLKALNRSISGYMSSYFLTGIYSLILYDEKEDIYRLKFSNGAHPSPIVVRKSGDVELLESHGSLIGLMENVEYNIVECTLYHGDRIFIYTDGLPEMTDHITGVPIGSGEELKQIFRHDTTTGMGNILDNIMNRLDTINGGAGFQDDLLIVGISLI